MPTAERDATTVRDPALPRFSGRLVRRIAHMGWFAGLLPIWFAVPALAQTISASTYPFAATSGAVLEDMSSGTTTLVGANLDDAVSAVTAIGFDFWFVGTRHTQFSVNSNGLLRLGSTVVGNASSNNLASSAQTPQVASYWDDLWVGINGKVHYRVAGAAPTRRLVVEWQNMQVPRVGTGQLGAATWQCWLSESTGAIEFVYGSGFSTNSAQAGASVGFGSSASVFASVTVSTGTVAYGTANNVNTIAVPAGTRYGFAPPVPAAPTGLAFTGVTAVSMVLNWTDASANETGFVLYRSTDGTNFTFASQVPGNSTASTQFGLTPSTTYYWRVHAVTEGALSGGLSGDQATSLPGLVTTTGSGNWSSTTPDAPWPGGVLPTPSDIVTIADGHAVTSDVSANCLGLAVGQGASGELVFESSSARTLTVAGDVGIAVGGQLRTAATGTQTGHVLSVAGQLANDGTLDLSTNGDLAGATLTFTSAMTASLSGSGPVTDLRSLTVNKGSGFAAVLTLEPTSLTVRGLASGAPGFATITNGTLRFGGSYPLANPVFTTAAYVMVANAGLWLDNPNMTATAQSASPSSAGLLRVTQGTFRVGTAADHSFQLFTGASVWIEGGLIEASGRFAVQSSPNRVTYVQTGGTLVVPTVGNTSTTLASFDLGTQATSSVSISGGSIVLQTPSTAASGPRDFRNSAGIQAVTGGTLQLGNASTVASSLFRLTGTGPGLSFTGASAGHTAVLAANFTAGGTSTVAATDTLRLNGFRFSQAGGDLVNDGLIASTTGNSELSFLGTGSGQTYSGSGALTVPLQGVGLTIDNPDGVTLSPSIPQNIITQRVNLARGTLFNSQLLTVGNSDTTVTTIIQRGATAQTDAAGEFDVAPTFNLGPAGLSLVYQQAGSPTLTSLEVPSGRSVRALTVNSTNGMVIAGGALTVTSTLTLTSGIIQSSAASTLRLANSMGTPPTGSAASYVEGPLAIEFAVGSATNRTYAIGAAGAHRPLVLKSVNTGGISRDFTAEVVPGATGGTPLSPLAALTSTRYWYVQNSANLNATARVNLTFGSDDNIGTLANARVGQATSASGSYGSLGGTTTGTATAGTVESNLNLTPGSGFFAIASTGALASTWDGGAGTSSWSDDNNWSPDGVPTASTVVSLSLASPTTITVNGTFSTSNLTVGSNVTLAVGSGTLNVTGTLTELAGALTLGSGALNVTGASTLPGGTLEVGAGAFTATGALTLSGVVATITGGGSIISTGNFTLSGGSLSLGNGTLEVKANFTRTAGLFNGGTGTTLVSGSNTQTISAGVVHSNLVLRNGGAGKPKRFEADIAHSIANDLTVESNAQVGLTASNETRFSVFGSFGYSGIAGGTGVSSMRIDLRGSGRTISGAGGGITSLMEGDAGARVIPVPPMRRHELRTDPAHGVWLPDPAGGKARLRLDHTYEKERAEVTRLLAAADPEERIVIELDDATIIRNPASFASHTAEDPLQAMVGSGGETSATPITTIPMPVTVETAGSYSLAENVTMASGQTLSVRGRLDAIEYTIGGAGLLSLEGTLSTTVNNAAGLGATVLTTGSNTYLEGSTVEYAAFGDQVVNATNHPASSMLRTSGSGTKTLGGSKTFTGGSGFALTNGVIFVGPGTTFADGGSLISFATSQYANVVVQGAYVSTGSGGLSYEAGAFDSNVQAPDGTNFGDLKLNFSESVFPLDLNAAGSGNFTFRSVTLGGTAGGGTAGGTLRMSETGTTNVTVTGSVQIVPRDSTSSGGGFGGTASKSSTVTLLGDVFSTSRAAVQPWVNTTGSNTLVLAGGAPQTVTLDSSTTVLSGVPVLLTNPAGLVLGALGHTLTLGSGGSLAIGAANVVTGANTLGLDVGATLSRTTGRVVGRLEKPIAAGPGVGASFEIGSATDETPVSVSFGSVAVAGRLAASSTTGEHPLVSGSGLDSTQSVNRWYELGNTGVVFDSCAVTLGFPASDVDAGADPAAFVVRRYDAPNWSFPATGARTATSTQVTGLTSFSNFAVGESRFVSVVANAGANGAVSPDGSTSYMFGSAPTYSITPATGYHVVDVLVDGISVGAVTSYTFPALTGDRTLVASFEINTYIITASAGANGSISPSDTVGITHGSDTTFTFTPDPRYRVADVLVDGVSVGTLASYTFTSVTASHTIDVSFVEGASIAAGAPATPISTVHPCVIVPVDISRPTSEPVRGFSVSFTLSPGLELCAGSASVTEGTFLNSFGSTIFRVTDRGAGSYTVDGVILGTTCGPTGATGRLFDIAVRSSLPSATATITLDSLKLRDCANMPLLALAAAPASVLVDNTPPTIAVIAPNGGEVWTIGATQAIVWTAGDVGAGVDSVRIEYSTDDGATWPHVVATQLPNSGSHDWTVPDTRSMTVRVRVTAIDAGGNRTSDSSDAAFEIRELNVAPVLAAIGDRSVPEGVALAFTASATDANLPAQGLTFTLAPGAPVGATIDPGTGSFGWTPGETHGPGDHSITIRVFDDGVPALSDSETIVVHVAEVNVAPVLADVPATATIPELAAYAFTATATDADVPAQTLTFSLVGAPDGAAIDGTTGAFAWTPSEIDGPGEHPFTVRVSDGVMNTDASLTLTVTEVNAVPVLANVPESATIPELAAYTFTATGTDGDVPAQTLAFSLVGAPSGASIGAESGAFSWTPAETDGPGVYSFTVRVSDGVTNTDASITLTVSEANAAPVLAGVPPSATIPELAGFTFTATATDSDVPTQALGFSLIGAPSGASIGAASGAFNWTPSETDGPGVYSFTVRVSDDVTNTDASVTLTVSEANVAPVLAGVPPSATIPELAEYTFTATATDADMPAQTLAFSLIGAPSGASIGAASGAFSWTPAETDGPGVYPFTVRVSDGIVSADAAITLTVSEANAAPALTNVPATATIPELAGFTFTATATDSDVPTQALGFSLIGAPSGASIGAASGAFNWTPSETDGPGVYSFTVRVSDDVTNTDASVTLTVSEANAAPVLAGVPPSATIPELAEYTFTATATDADMPAQTLTFSLIGAPAGASIGAASGAFNWTPSETDGPGVYPFTVRVSDGVTNTDASITLTVAEANAAPSLTNVPATATIPELAGYTFTATATDSDVPTQTLGFSLIGAPSGASIGAASGAFNWTPSETDGPGVYSFTVRVSDGVASTDASITLTVTEGNTAPVIAGVPASASISESAPYTFTATATDADVPAQPLAFSLVSAPLGAAIDGGTGVLTWTPSETQGPGSYPFTVRVSDGTAGADAAITITVTEANTVPVIAGVPAAVTIPELVPFTFTATATDADVPVQSLTFSLVGAPAGASIGAGTGVFTWTPTEAQGPGVYAFAVRSSDGVGAADAPISITVSEVTVAVISDLAAAPVNAGNDADGTTTIHLSWTATAPGTTVEVYRAAFGGYPLYDDAGGAAPIVPGYPPGAPWTLTSVTAPGGTDAPATRDQYYYVAFVKGVGLNVSAVSNRTNGTLDYQLGDFTDGFSPTTGDNQVNVADLSALGSHYGIAGPAVLEFAYLDVGPTSDGWVTGLPLTDQALDFEDLVMVAVNFGAVSGPQASVRPSSPAGGPAPDIFSVEAPSRVGPAGARANARMLLSGSGRIHGLSAALQWDSTVVRPLSVNPGALVASSGGVVLSPAPGAADAVLLGARSSGLSGEGVVAEVVFEVLRAGDPRISIASVVARDAANRPVQVTRGLGAPRALPQTTALAMAGPNPFRGKTAVELALAHAGAVEAELFSVDGRRVRRLATGMREPGVLRLVWDGRDDDGRGVPAGVYFLRLEADRQRFTRRLVMLR